MFQPAAYEKESIFRPGTRFIVLVGKSHRRARDSWPLPAADYFDNPLVHSRDHSLDRRAFKNWARLAGDPSALDHHANRSALQYVGLQYTSAVNVSILNSLVPVLIIAASALIFRDRIFLVQLLGILTSLIGVLIIVTKGELDALLQLSFNHGDVIIIANMIVFAIYAACLRLGPKIHWMSFLFMFAIISAVGTAPFAIFEFVSGRSPELNVGTIAAAIYVSIFPSLMAFAAWNYGVEHIGANRSGPFLHLIPLYTALFAGIFLNEEIMTFHVFGLLSILVGVWIAARGHPPPIGQSRS